MPEKPMHATYQEYYQRVATSNAFSSYCEAVFGIDLSQDGFADKKQLDFMITTLQISAHDVCLDVGCGNGRIANYVNVKTKARVDGIDYSQNAIASAHKIGNEYVYCRIEDINRMQLVPKRYSVIYLIDTIYFSENYCQTLQILYDALHPAGRIGIFYSEMIFKNAKQLRKIPGRETQLAREIDATRFDCEVYDLTEPHYRLMKRKRCASIQYERAL